MGTIGDVVDGMKIALELMDRAKKIIEVTSNAIRDKRDAFTPEEEEMIAAELAASTSRLRRASG